MNATTRRFLATLTLSLALTAGTFAAPCHVNVQTAGAKQLAFLPGVGPALAGRIASVHPKSQAELDAVHGIGPARLAKMLPFLTYGTTPTTCTAKQGGKGGGK